MISVQPEGAYGFFGDFSSWAEARQQSDGYDAAQILEKVCTSTLKVKNGQCAYERDSVCFDQIQHEWIEPLAKCLSLLALEYNNSLNIIDFGGSLGSTYFTLRNMLSKLSNAHWNVIEQSHFVEKGNALIADAVLKFYSSVEECLKISDSKILLLSGVIQYIENPYQLLDQLVTNNFDYIIFDRTPFINRNHDRLTIQYVPPGIYAASYPCWFFTLENLFRPFEGKYDLVSHFNSLEQANIPSIHKGLVFKKH